MRVCVTFAILAASLASASDVRACATCAVGDPTLTLFGTERAFEGRVRLSATAHQRQSRIGGATLRDHRLELGAAYAPTEWLTLSALVPVVHRRIDFPNLARERRWALADVDLRARFRLFQDRPQRPRHVLSGSLGLELPTTTRVRSVQIAGPAPSHAAQVGSRSWDPLAGLQYSTFLYPFAFHLLAVYLHPLSEGPDGVRAGGELRTTARLQWQPKVRLGLFLGGDLRVEAQDRMDGRRDADSGGAVALATAGLQVRAHDALSLFVSASIPFWQDLRGGHEDRYVLSLGLVVDP